MVEIVDLIFAVDSVPAVFALTTEPFIVYTSSIFTILGLRTLYFALALQIPQVCDVHGVGVYRLQSIPRRFCL